ncbi:hypothetical protein [Natronobiforma cellulositropha]|uniref:hypothetical protein n=1 Tax=Natronobiforma cellulositropha TaxID=1679076 RepID=UPI0021D57306|nr:hypothetical protein [Natronobiforma cellulositropha]
MTIEPLDTVERVALRWDRVFEALAAEPRRQLLVALDDASPDGCISLPEAATSPGLSTDPAELRVRLRHQHLPLLEDGGFVHWDDDPLRARRGPNFDEVAVVFDSLYRTVEEIPEQLVVGCHRLESERTQRTNR